MLSRMKRWVWRIALAATGFVAAVAVAFAAIAYTFSDGSTTIAYVMAWVNSPPYGSTPVTLLAPLPVVLVPGAGQGCSPYHKPNGTTASSNATNVKAAAGTLCHLLPSNPTGSNAFLKLYDTAGVPSCNSSTGLVHVYQIFANTNLTGGGFGLPLPLGEAYQNGIGYCVVGGSSDTDSTNAPVGILIEGSYK